MAQLLRYDWPGNVRELRNVIKSGVATADHDAVWIEDLPLTLEMNTAEAQDPATGLWTLTRPNTATSSGVLLTVNWKKVDAARSTSPDRDTSRNKG